MTVIGLVVEGTNDFPVFASMLDELLPKGFSRPLKFKHIQPEADATTGAYGGGGWGRVVGWCKANSGTGLNSYFEPISEEDEPCDFILVQLDGDCVAECSAHSTINPPPKPWTAVDRVNAISGMIEGWLKVPPVRGDQIRFAVPVMHSEAWIMAGLRPKQKDWEGEPDAKAAFRALKKNHGKGTILQFYSDKAKEVSKMLDSIKEQCQSFAKFKDGIDSLP